MTADGRSQKSNRTLGMTPETLMGSSDGANSGKSGFDQVSDGRLSRQIVEEARGLFERRSGRRFTPEDARQILENLIGFFAALHRWGKKE